MLGENVKYSDIVDWLVAGVKSYCKNIDNLNGLPTYVRSGLSNNIVYDKVFSKGTKQGKHGGIKDTGYFKLTITGGAVSAISESNMRTVAENYIKKVNSTLSSNITNAKLQAVYQAIISFCNDTIHIVSAACPFYDDFNSFSYCELPIFVSATPPDSFSSTSLIINSSQMIKTLDDFSTIVRKNLNPKINTVTYSITSYKK